MKRKMFFGLMVCLLMLTGLLTLNKLSAIPIQLPDRPIMLGGALTTEIKPWALLRTPGVVDGLVGEYLAIEDMCYATMIDPNGISPATGVFDVYSQLGWNANGVTIAFFTTSASDAANDVFDVEIYAYKDSWYGPAMPVFLTTGNQCIIGTYPCLKHPTLGTTQASGKWVDTIAGTDCWPGGCTINDSGNNRLCTISFDLRGCRFVKFRVWAAAGTTKAVAIGAIITGH